MPKRWVPGRERFPVNMRIEQGIAHLKKWRAHTVGLPGPSPRPAPPDSTGAPELTRREHEVAQLIARGLTNKAIAGALVLSPRTVDGHVERLFDKIGVNSRTQVAVWLARHRQESRLPNDL